MTFCSARRRWILLILSVVCLAGCSLTSNDQDEKKEAHYLTGKNRQQSMDYKGAAEAFEKALEVNPQSSAAHLELGLLYAEKFNEGITTEEERGRNLATAIYHLEKYIQLNPKSAWVVRVRGQIEGCKYELAKTVPFTLLPSTVQAELERLNSNNTSLRQQIEQLKLQLIQQAHAFSNRLASLPTQTLAMPHLASYSIGNTTGIQTNSLVVDPPTVTRQLPPAGARQVIALQKQRASLNSKPGAALSPSIVAVSRTHKVRSGETLASIARAHRVPLGSLMAANPGVEPRKLKVGQTLNLPAVRS